MRIKFFFLLLLVGLFSSCGKSGQKSAFEPNTLHIAIGASPQSLDPHVATGMPAMKVLAALSERLVQIDGDTLEVKPAAAKRWDVSEDGLRFTFHLRENLRWSNGDPVVAQDFLYAWHRAMTPSVGWQLARDFYAIKGAKEYHSGDSKDPASLGIRALDKHTLEFQLIQPFPLFLKQLTNEIMGPIHQAGMEKHGAFDDINSRWSNAGHYINNGPFVLKRWEVNQVIELEKNPHYWDKDNVKLDKIYLYPLEPETAEERAFRSGQIQFAYGNRIPVEKIAVYQEKSPEELRIVHGYSTYFYLFNTQKPPFNDARVRQALAHAIDRESIVKNITKAGEGPAHTLNPPASPNFSQITPIRYDAEKAKRLLADAGFPNGNGFPAVSLMYNSSDLHRKVALAIQQMWKNVLGVDVTLENQEWKVFLNTRQHLDYDIARAGSVSGIGDPQDFLESYTTGHGLNDTGWSHAEYDALVHQASKTMNEEARFALLARAENLLLQEMPLIPLYYYADSYLIRKEVKGMSFNAIKRIDYKSIYIEPSDGAK